MSKSQLLGAVQVLFVTAMMSACWGEDDFPEEDGDDTQEDGDEEASEDDDMDGDDAPDGDAVAGEPQWLLFQPGDRPFEMGCANAVEELCTQICEGTKTVYQTAFRITRTEITRAQYVAHMGGGTNGCPNCPVTNVTWDQARAFCAALESDEGIPARLPTEAEWELAARRGENGAFLQTVACGAGDCTEACPVDSLCRQCPRCVAVYDAEGVAEVGSLHESPAGLSDMLGNAAEWVEDVYTETYPPHVQNSCQRVAEPQDETWRVVRGGSYDDDKVCFSTRQGWPKERSEANIGFRCAADVADADYSSCLRTK